MTLSSENIRDKRSDFRESKQHKLVKPVSLIAADEDKTVIFNVAGMQQLVPYLSGKPHPDGTRLYNIQPCVRTVDIEEIGDERHLSLFEMMGHRSLGDYFKKEALEWTIEFLTNWLGIPLENLGYGIFGGYTHHRQDIIPLDNIAKDTLIALGIPAHKIKAIPMCHNQKCDNFRGPAGSIGPCGPCAEPHFDRGEQFGPADWNIGQNDRYLEIGNNVFMEFYKNDQGGITKLSQQNVDTGMGFERLVMVMQQADSIFETDLFEPIIRSIENFATSPYPPYNKKQSLNIEMQKQQADITKSYRIIADHIRSTTFLIAQGVVPSNESRGYVVRRLIRRMYYHYIVLTKDPRSTADWIKQTVNATIKKYEKTYEMLHNKQKNIVKIFIDEITQFQKTLERGEKKLNEIIRSKSPTSLTIALQLHPHAQNLDNSITGQEAFLLYDTFGFPLDLTIEIAQQQGYQVDHLGFESSLEQAKDRSRNATANKFSRDTDRAKYLQNISPTKFIGYDQREQTDPTILKQFELDGQYIMIFDSTPFYAESGGQTGDNGQIILDDGTSKTIIDVKKYDSVYLHFVQ